MINKLGGRKTLWALMYVISSTWLGVLAMEKNPPPLMELSTVIGAMAIGIGALVWGNVKEHSSKTEKES